MLVAGKGCALFFLYLIIIDIVKRGQEDNRGNDEKSGYGIKEFFIEAEKHANYFLERDDVSYYLIK